MTYSFENQTELALETTRQRAVQFFALLLLILQSFFWTTSSGYAQETRSAGLFGLGKNALKSRNDGRDSSGKFTFFKSGKQKNCDYVSYKIRFTYTGSLGYFDRAEDIARFEAIRLNLRDQLPAGLSVTTATISGDVLGAGGGGPVVAIGTIASPNDTVSIPGFRFDTSGLGAGSTTLSFEVTINAKIDRAAFAAPRNVDNQASLEFSVDGSSGTVLSHDPDLPEDADPLSGAPTGIVIDLTDCDRVPEGGGTPEGEACFKLVRGEIDCATDGGGGFTYRMPFGPEMGGRSVELVPLTPGIVVVPATQIVPAGGGTLEWTILGAAPGMSLRFSVVGTEISAGPAEGWGLCCAQIIEIVIPEDIDCPDPQKEPDLEVKKQALVSECRIGGGCKFRITVINRGDAPYTGPIALDEVVTQGPAIIDGGPNAPWTCVPDRTPMTCKHPATTLNPGEAVVLELSLRHLTRRRWEIITNCAELDYTASGIATPFGDLTNDKACASIPIRYPRDPQNPEKADLRLLKRANATQCNPNGFCHFTILVTNVGSTTYTGPLVIDDTYPSGAPIASSFAPNPPWSCASTGANSYQCRTLGNVTLTPNASLPLSVKAQVNPASYPSKLVENCAEVRQIPLETNLTNNRACASQALAGRDQSNPDLSIDKKCAAIGDFNAARCTITVTNNGDAAASGRVRVFDAAQLISSNTATTIVMVDPDGPEWECTPVPAPNLTCEIPGGLLTPGTSRSFDASAYVGRGDVELENCAKLTVVPVNSDNVRPVGESCARVSRKEERQCSETFILNDNGRCVCPKGTKYRGGKCVQPGGVVLPVPPVTPKLCKLKPGQVRTQSGKCVCRRGTILNQAGSRCIRRPAAQCKLKPGQVRTQSGKCVCRRGTILNQAGSRCIRRPATQCKLKPGQVRTQSGKCVCRRGTILNQAGSRCIRRPAAQCTLKPGQVRTQSGKCVCRRGTVLNRNRTRCIRPRVRCPKGTIGQFQPNCRKIERKRCPKGTIGRFQPNCRKIVRKRCPKGTIGRFQPNCRKIVRKRCPKGTIGRFQPNCRKIVRKRCPRGTVGRFQPNCRKIVRKRCPRGTVGRFQPNCRKIRAPRPSQGLKRCRKPRVLFRGKCVIPLQ